MTKVVVIAKKDQTIINETQTSKIQISQPSIVQLDLKQEDIQTIHRVGNQCVITLKNGQKIIIDDFYTDDFGSPNTLVLKGTQSQYDLVEMDVDGKTVSYRPVDELMQPLSSFIQQVPTQTMAEASLPVEESDASSSSSMLKAGLAILGAEALYLVAFDQEDDDSSNNSNPDKTPPDAPTGDLDNEGKEVSGKAEAGATVYIADLKGNILGKATVGNDGSYKIILDQAITDGSKAIMYVKDSAGNQSKAILVTGDKDTIAPDAANAQVNDDGGMVFGEAEAGTTVYVYAADGETIIGSASVALDGSFSIPVSPALKPGETATVIVKDDAGNRSASSTVEVGRDTLAPNQPKFEVAEDGSLVKGTAEPGAKVEITDSNGKLIGTGQANELGDFEITLSPALAKGEKANITAEDAAGNQSQPVEITAGQDNIAPEPTEAKLNDEGSEITGKAEPGSKIEIRQGNSLLGSGIVAEDGTYAIKLSPPLTDQKTANVYVIDASGNKSDPKKITGKLDTKAPDVPELPTVYDDTGESKSKILSGGTTQDGTPIFEGKGEKNATITIYQNGIAIQTVKVDGDGKWTYTPENDLPAGKYSYTFSQTDSAGNPSAKSPAFEFSVEQATEVKVSEIVVDAEEAIDALYFNHTLEELNSNLMDVLLQGETDFNPTDEISSEVEHQIDIESLLSRNPFNDVVTETNASDLDLAEPIETDTETPVASDGTFISVLPPQDLLDAQMQSVVLF